MEIKLLLGGRVQANHLDHYKGRCSFYSGWSISGRFISMSIAFLGSQIKVRMLQLLLYFSNLNSNPLFSKQGISALQWPHSYCFVTLLHIQIKNSQIFQGENQIQSFRLTSQSLLSTEISQSLSLPLKFCLASITESNPLFSCLFPVSL